jgi:hypothetical protein
MKYFAFILLTLSLAGGLASAADMAVLDGGGAGDPAAWGGPSALPGPTAELLWDNGTRRWSYAWYTGTGWSVGNDFNTATLVGRTNKVKILKFKMLTRADWPNTSWDGFRISFWSFAGGSPGSKLWPTGSSGYFFKPSAGAGHVWVECDINWTCPNSSFVAAEEQYYNWPNCDAFAVDNNMTFLYHSWMNQGGSAWAYFNATTDPLYRNLMIRVIVDTNANPGVAPTSIGRIKALYY